MAQHCTLRTRKPIVALTVSDFRRFPVWEFAVDEESPPGRDETWVRPVHEIDVRRNRFSQLVSAAFTLAGGGRIGGFMIVSTADRIEVTPGALLGRARYRPLPALSRKQAAHQRARWALDLRSAISDALSRPERHVFPLEYKLNAFIAGERALRAGVVR